MLQWCRDLLAAEIRDRPTSICGATVASMGPRLVSRGNKWWIRYKAAGKWLQWGRDLLAAEIWQVVRERWAQYAASMGPRLVSRGNLSQYADGSRWRMASMG